MIKYLFFVLLNCAVIVQSSVNVVPQLFTQPLNVYVYSVVAGVGVAVTVVHQILNLQLVFSMIDTP